jgi:hypothetical protein
MRYLAMLLVLVAGTAFASDDPSAQIIDDVFPSSEPCIAGTPESVWDLPSCDDFHIDEPLIEAAQRNDRSAIALLEQRYAAAFTRIERYSIAEVLLNRVKDDRAMWKALETDAADAVRLFGHHESDTPQYDAALAIALGVASGDRRSRPLMMRALQSSDTSVVFTAISGLGRQHDASALPAIEATLRRLPEDAHQLAMALWEYDSIDADMLAREFLGDEEREQYFEEWRR